MTRTKNNPKLSHDQWLLIQKEQIKMITKLQEEKEDLERKVGELEEETKKNKEVKEENEKMKTKVVELEEELKKNQEVMKENEKLRIKVEELEEKLCGRVEEMEVFWNRRRKKFSSQEILI
jgi:cell shape-determining protein MreC